MRRVVATEFLALDGVVFEPEEAYPALLQQKIDSAGLPFEIVNAGVSGETSAGALRRTDWLLRQPWADRNRVFAAGGSYGGFMSSWLVTQDRRDRLPPQSHPQPSSRSCSVLAVSSLSLVVVQRTSEGGGPTGPPALIRCRYGDGAGGSGSGTDGSTISMPAHCSSDQDSYCSAVTW